MAKLGIALGSGPRDLGFESRHSDHKKHLPRQVLFSFHAPFGSGCVYTLTRFTRVFLVPSQTKTTVSDKRRAAGRPANASRTLGGHPTSFGPLDQRRVAADNTSRTLVLPCASFGPRDHKLLRKLEFGAFLPPSLREVAERKRSRREFRSKEGHPLSHG